MQIKAIGQWSSEALGNVTDGDVLELDPFLAEQFIQRGYAVKYETKVVRQEPDLPLDHGQGKDASLSQAAPASPKKIATSSKKKK